MLNPSPGVSAGSVDRVAEVVGADLPESSLCDTVCVCVFTWLGLDNKQLRTIARNVNLVRFVFFSKLCHFSRLVSLCWSLRKSIFLHVEISGSKPGPRPA